MTTLYIVRHGETSWNVVGRYQGQLDPPLNQQGHPAEEIWSLLPANGAWEIFEVPV